ncbi:pyridoxamine 5'-phosphate oxidase family protein [Halodesulfovibrio aestuarii]|uniref:Pyridoxamine 5'-phosphate oxidase family protein n=1 Tax=Halodesulfovibrio aestuarii TaxID=126333 RepID=A0ABV4JX97_9BACT
MFRNMRRKKQMLSIEECISVFESGTSGVLAVLGDENYPYAVPLSYAYVDSKIFFHCAKSGHKLDAITNSNKCSFCVIDKDEIIQHKYTTYYRSVIAFGKISIIQDVFKKKEALKEIAKRYSPRHEKGRLEEIDKLFEKVFVLELKIEHMTGKQAIELVNKNTLK